MSQSENVHSKIDDGTLVFPWRERIEQKYTKLPGIRSLHDFVAVRHPETGKAFMTIREYSYGGPTKPAPIKEKGHGESVTPTENYIQSGKIRTLPRTKHDHLVQMYTKFIPVERQLLLLTVD